MAKCPMCGGSGMLLGVLGFLRWFTCRNCGWEFSREIERKKDTKKKEK